MKRSVAKAAAELIQPGHRVILDSGTTTFEIARLMRKHTDVIAMTNGMNVANALLEAEGVELLMTGGHLRRQSHSFYGDQAEQSLQNYHFDMLFLGVDAIDLERGVSTHNEDEARLNRRMCEVAERIIVVTDSSKFNRSSLHKIIDTQRIDMIIVDEGIPADNLEGLRKAGVEVILVGRRKALAGHTNNVRRALWNTINGFLLSLGALLGRQEMSSFNGFHGIRYRQIAFYQVRSVFSSFIHPRMMTFSFSL